MDIAAAVRWTSPGKDAGRVRMSSYGRNRGRRMAASSVPASASAPCSTRGRGEAPPTGSSLSRAAVRSTPSSACRRGRRGLQAALGRRVRPGRERSQELLGVAARDSQSKVDRKTDDLGYEWIIVRDDELEDLVTTVHLIDSQLKEGGFDEQLLAAVFRFKGYEHPVYWIYGYKRGAFWPFVPTGTDKERDNAKELELKAQLEKELPIEPEIARWFALFDAPV